MRPILFGCSILVRRGTWFHENQNGTHQAETDDKGSTVSDVDSMIIPSDSLNLRLEDQRRTSPTVITVSPVYLTELGSHDNPDETPKKGLTV